MLYLNSIKKGNVRDKKNFTHGKFLEYLSVYIKTTKKGGKVRTTNWFSHQKFALVFQCLYFLFISKSISFT